MCSVLLFWCICAIPRKGARKWTSIACEVAFPPPPVGVQGVVTSGVENRRAERQWHWSLRALARKGHRLRCKWVPWWVRYRTTADPLALCVWYCVDIVTQKVKNRHGRMGRVAQLIFLKPRTKGRHPHDWVWSFKTNSALATPVCSDNWCRGSPCSVLCVCMCVCSVWLNIEAISRHFPAKG